MSDLDKVTVIYFYMLGLSCSGHCCSGEKCGPQASCLNLAILVIILLRWAMWSMGRLFEPSYFGHCLGEQCDLLLFCNIYINFFFFGYYLSVMSITLTRSVQVGPVLYALYMFMSNKNNGCLYVQVHMRNKMDIHFKTKPLRNSTISIICYLHFLRTKWLK